jgi:hypothetical protein
MDGTQNQQHDFGMQLIQKFCEMPQNLAGKRVGKTAALIEIAASMIYDGAPVRVFCYSPRYGEEQQSLVAQKIFLIDPGATCEVGFDGVVLRSTFLLSSREVRTFDIIIRVPKCPFTAFDFVDPVFEECAFTPTHLIQDVLRAVMERAGDNQIR